jgi:hypothetical protein
MSKILLYIIHLIHLLFVLFIVLAPLSNINAILTLHCVTVPFLFLHWITNNDVCALTLAEYHIRKKLYGEKVNDTDGFLARIINPIFHFPNDNKDLDRHIHIITFVLFLISSYKLYRKIKNKEIQTWQDFLVY